MKKNPYKLLLARFRRSGDNRNAVITASLLLFACLALGYSLVSASGTDMYDRTYSTGEGQEETFEFPLKISNAPAGIVTVHFTLHTGMIRPRYYHIVPDDCLESVEINGTRINDPQLPFCDYTNGRTLDLSSHLKTGENIIVVQVLNHGGDALLQFNASWKDPTSYVPAAFIALSLLVFGIFLVRKLNPPLWVALLGIVLITATLLRIFYMLSMPYWTRGHDTDGHIEYIEYIAENWNLPVPNAGWEFWQPPLYYALGGVWYAIGEMLAFTRMEILTGLQVGALFLSVATLALCTWMGFLLFDRKERPESLPLFVGLIAFIPGLIFAAARINNDVLGNILAFGVVALLLSWWKKQSLVVWIAISFLIALHLLTKNTGLLLLPVVFGCLLFRKNFSWKKKIGYGLLSLFIVVLFSGWFSVYRYFQDSEQGMIVGNTGTLNSGLAVPNNPAAFLVFNPAKVVEIPFNNPWDDAFRRQYFWEYWYRSAFFGEFQFEGRKLLASWVIFWSLLVCVIALRGIIFSFFSRQRLYASLPLLFLLLVYAAGHAVFRFQHPYGSSQDFRYSVIILISLAYYAVLGINGLKHPLMQKILTFTAQTFIVLCAMFLLHF